MIADGYKDTEIGIIPIEWDIVSLGDTVKFKNGKGHEKSIDEDGQYIVVNSKFISTNGNIYKSSNSNLSPLKTDDITLVMSDIPNGKALAKCFYINEDNKYTLNQRICSLTAIKDNPLYLFYRLNRNRYFLKFNDGVNQTNLRKNEVLECKIPLPPLKEQEKIADILSTADDKIDAIAIQIDRAETLKKGLLQKLLSEGIGHSEFKDSELGKIPASWEVVKLNEVCKFKQGIQVPLEEQSTTPLSDNIRFIRISDYTQSTDDIRYVSNSYSDYVISKDDVVMVRYGETAGFIGTNISGVLANNLFSMNPNEKISKKYLYTYMNDEKIYKYLKSLRAAGAMPAVSFKSLNIIKIPLPPLEEQKQIANILSTADEKLEVLRAKKEKYETLKKGLLQKLLSGEVRV